MLYIIQYPRRWLQVLRIFLGTKCRMFQIVSTTHVRSCVVPFKKSLYIGNLWFIYETVFVTWHIAKWYFASIVKGVRLDHISVRAFSYQDFFFNWLTIYHTIYHTLFNCCDAYICPHNHNRNVCLVIYNR